MALLMQGGRYNGYKIVTSTSLNSIGNVIARYDYRFAVDKITIGDDFVLSVDDLGTNNYKLSALGVNRLRLFADGFGSNGSSIATIISIAKPPQIPSHNGNAHFGYIIARYDNPTNIDSRFIFNTAQTTGDPYDGFTIQNLAASNQLSHIFINDSASLGSHNTGTNTLPEDSTFRLITFTYYGSGAGANNARITIANNSYLRTTSPTFGTGDSRYFRFTIQSTDNCRVKAFGLYDLSGQSIAQVNAFVTKFNTTLLLDSEYSGLVTI